jgi:hypothetical protein
MRPMSEYPAERVSPTDDLWGPEVIVRVPAGPHYPQPTYHVAWLEADVWTVRDPGERAACGMLAGAPDGWCPIPAGMADDHRILDWWQAERERADKAEAREAIAREAVNREVERRRTLTGLLRQWLGRHRAERPPSPLLVGETREAVGGLSWAPTHVHRKSGGRYRVLRRGAIERDLTPCVVYEGADGRVWVRPAAEFDDGRFLPIGGE